MDPNNQVYNGQMPQNQNIGENQNFMNPMAGFNYAENSIFPNPANPAMPYENQALNDMPGYYQPYRQAGQSMISPLMKQYSNLMSNPGGMINQMGKSFHQSPGFQFALHQALMGANNASAAGGMAGSPMAQQQNMQIGSQMGNQDYYNWLQQAQDMYGAGLNGAQGMENQGYDASNSLAQNMSDILNNQAMLQYAGQADQNQETGSLIGDFFKGAH